VIKNLLEYYKRSRKLLPIFKFKSDDKRSTLFPKIYIPKEVGQETKKREYKDYL